MNMLNEKATAVYDYIRRQSERGIPPTVREICAALEIRSTSTVHRYVQILVEEGYLEKFGNHNRALRLTGVQGIRVPLLESLSFEDGLLSVENIRRYVSFDADGAEDGALFAWEISEEDVIPAVLSVGDVIIIERTERLSVNGLGLFIRGNQVIIGTDTDSGELLGQLVSMIHRF